MALWNGLGQLATVAQLTGVDAGGLISMILEAVQTAKRNGEECRHLARRAMMIGDLLQKLQGWDMMQDPEIRRPLDGLDDALREAYVLIVSCQDCTVMYRFFMGWKQAEQFREVQRKIDTYIQLYPFISHIDITRRLDKICNNSNPSSSQVQVKGETLEPCVISHSNRDTRTAGDGHTETRSVQEDVERYLSEEHQRPGYWELYSSRSIRKNKYMWCCLLLQYTKSQPYTPPWYTDRWEIGVSPYRLSVLKAATNNFSPQNLIGCGGFGTVYKGKLHGGPVAAIKRCPTFREVSEQKDLSREFEAEIRILPKLRHANIVRLLGYCTERGERILVYEYISNGSLVKFIFGARTSLDWSLRFRIIMGIAQGIVYLHEYCGISILHGDLKPANVLLDYRMNPKIIDFGVARILGSSSTMNEYGIRGTYGYIDPEYIIMGRCSCKSDVYSFGVTLLEIITGRRCMRISSFCEGPLQGGLDYTWKMWTAGRSLELIDPSLRDEPQIAEILRCIQIALLCIEPRQEDRPTMADVIRMLSSDSVTLPFPQRRGYEDAQVGSTSYSKEQTQSGALDSTAQQA